MTLSTDRISTLIALLSVLAAACAAEVATQTPAGTDVSSLGKADVQLSESGEIACADGFLDVRAEPIEALPEGLDAADGIPLPSLVPDAEGYFYPPPGYTEGGTFTFATGDVEPTLPRRGGSFLRVVEWNVARGEGLEEIVERMQEIDADVWILNESDLYGLNSGEVVVAREIARALGYSYYTGIEFYERKDERRGTSGNGIVSRYPLSDGRFMDIPIFEEHGGHDWARDRFEPRCGQRSALSAWISVPDARGGTTRIQIVSIHAENKTNYEVREMQYDAVREELTTPGVPTVIAGDMNTLYVDALPFRGHLEKTLVEVGGREATDHGHADAFFDCSRGDLRWSHVGGLLDWVLVQTGDDDAIACLDGTYDVLDSGPSDHRMVLVDLFVRGALSESAIDE